MTHEENAFQDFDNRIADGIRGLGRRDAVAPDELTRARHLAAVRRAGRSRRRSVIALSAAASIIALIGGVVVISNEPPSLSSVASGNSVVSQTLPPLREAPQLSAVPFERSEDYVILTVSAARASHVAGELATIGGSDAAVVGKTDSATTFVVPASVAQSLSDTRGVTATVDTPVVSTEQQTNPPSWGLDRLDSPALDNSYSWFTPGSGQYVYIIDTGVYSSHSDFGGRVKSGYTAVSDGNGTEDCNGHGTHVAGTVAGTKYGVAKSSTIVAVRVLNCAGSGYASSVVAGINWAVASHPGGPGIINLSLGGSANSAIDQAVTDAAKAGLVVVVAAGNNSADACSYSPARVPAALTIGAIDRTNTRAAYSNTGSCVDMWAPGSSITSAGISGPTSSATMSGTSMASPHVAGLAARLVQARPGISASEITSELTKASLTTDPTKIPVVEFAETPDFATPTTLAPATTVDSTSTTLDGVTTTVPDVSTTAPAVTTTVPAVTTTSVPKGKKTRPRDDDKGNQPIKIAPQPKEFEIRFANPAGVTSNALAATWRDDGTPDSYRIDCTRLQGGENAPVETSISLSATDVQTIDGERRAVLPVAPAAGSRCRIVAIVGAVTSKPSNSAVIPPARKRKESPVTTTTVPVTTTVAPTTTVPVTSTTEPTVPDETTTTLAAAGKVNSTQSTVKPSTRTTAPPRTQTTVKKKKP